MFRFAPNAYTTLDIQLTTYYSDKLTPTHKLVDSDPSHTYANSSMDPPADQPKFRNTPSTNVSIRS